LAWVGPFLLGLHRSGRACASLGVAREVHQYTAPLQHIFALCYFILCGQTLRCCDEHLTDEKEMMLLLRFYHFLCATAVVETTAAAVRRVNYDCRTRFTLSRPTNENMLSILFGLDKNVQRRKNEPCKISYNHGDLITDLCMTHASHEFN
jgi:hypothetical protein